MTRLAAVQRCPDVPNADQMIPSTARSRSASSMTMMAFLPPSSRWMCFRYAAPFSAVLIPTSREPVSEMSGTSGCLTRRSPTDSPPPWTMLSTPAGSPASAKISTKRWPSSGVSRAGLKTTVFPQTSAGAIFQLGMAIGKFHGVIAPTTPTGMRTLIWNLSGISDGVVWPKSRRPSPAM